MDKNICDKKIAYVNGLYTLSQIKRLYVCNNGRTINESREYGPNIKGKLR
jgi:hypothetical protein